MEPEMTVQDRECLCVFTIKDLTCFLMATAYAFRHMNEGMLDGETLVAFEMMSEEHRQRMMERMGDLRPRVTQMIFDAIGDEASDHIIAMVQQKMDERDGRKPN